MRRAIPAPQSFTTSEKWRRRAFCLGCIFLTSASALIAAVPQHGSPNADTVKRQEIFARLAQKHGAVLVRFQAPLDRATERAPARHWIWGGVHPT